MESFVRSQMSGWLSAGSGVITYESIPQTVRDLLSTFGLNEESINGFLQGNSEDMVTNIANGIAEPMVTTIITIVLFFIIFFLCLILVRLIANATNIVNHVPLVGTANRILGGAMGIIKWGIVMILLSMAVQLVISLTNNELAFMNRQVVEDAFLFRHILKWNPLYWQKPIQNSLWGSVDYGNSKHPVHYTPIVNPRIQRRVFNRKGTAHVLHICGYFAYFGITDMLDGYIARKYNMVSELGKFLDPLR